MKSHATFLLIGTLFVALAAAQQAPQTGASIVPQLIPYSGTAQDVNGKPLSGVVGITFLLYQREQGGSPLWLETQNVQADSRGHYSVQLGATLPNGVPNDLFVTGEARWLGIQISEQSEAARVMLLSVPYALKAADAQTIGGLPPSAFVLAVPGGGSTVNTATSAVSSTTTAPPASSNVTTTGGTVNTLPLWTTATNIQNSAITQTGSGTTAKVGVNNSKPASTLDVGGAANIRGLLTLPATGVATSTAGKNSQPFTQVASAFSSGTNTAVNQTFQWQAEAVGNDTGSASGTLNLLFGQGSSKAAETGLHIASNGQINFASGQTFPGTGNGTITGVAAGTDLTGGGSSGNVTLNLDTTKVPQLNGGNSFSGNQTVSGNVSATQLVSTAAQGTSPLQVTSSTQVPNLNASFLDGLSASTFQVAGSYASLGANTFNATQTIGSGDLSLINGNLDLPQTTGSSVGVITSSGVPFIHACCAATSVNTFVGGNAGNFTTTGNGNTGTGYGALSGDTTGYYNAAFGVNALLSNTTGTFNLAAGAQAMQFNTVGAFDTAVGTQALYNSSGSYNVGVGSGAGNTTNNKATAGFDNTFVGYSANPGTQTSFNNVTAIGANAQVTAGNATAIGANAQATTSNALVLGSINGVNGATASTNVGIGTTSPAFTLDVHGTANFTGLVSFAPNQTFPGNGTVTSVGSGSGLTGGPITSSGTLSIAPAGVTNAMLANPSLTVSPGTGLTGGGAVSLGGTTTLNLDTTKVPLLAAGNTFTGNQTVNGNLSATGTVTGSAFNIGSNLFAFGSYTNNNVFLGFSGNSTTTGQGNTATGFQALNSNAGGLVNTATGYLALYSNQSGNNDAATGSRALYSNTTGIDNTAMGTNALISNTTGGDNTATGSGALYYNTTGNYNTATGYVAGSANTTGSDNSAFGFKALLNNMVGTDNTASGYEALYSNTNSENTAIGSQALYSNTTGFGNTATSVQSLYHNTTGTDNTAIGGISLSSNTTGWGNTGAGNGALYASTTGSYNTSVGIDSLFFNSTGSYNAGIGAASGGTVDSSGFSGQLDTFLGTYSAASTGTFNNSTAVGAYAEVGASNALVLGSIAGVNNCTASVNCASTNVGIGTITPAYTLDVHGTANFTGLVSFAPNQTFPGNGTVTSVGSGAGLVGGPITSTGTLSIATAGVTNAMLANSSVTVSPGTGLTGGGAVALGGATTLSLDTTKVPQLTASNTFTGDQTVNGNLSATGVVTGSAFNIGSSLFAFGSQFTYNTFLGFAGNTTTSGLNNTASGVNALVNSTTGNFNTANGVNALSGSTTGNQNTAGGFEALIFNSTGSNNTAMGYLSGVTADHSGLSANNDTFLGASAFVSTGTISNATAIGANAEVAQSNALVLGSINGVNGATADTAVGIGTTTPFTAPLSGNPATKLNIVGNNTYVPLVVQSPNTFGTWMLLDNTSSGGKPWAMLSAASGNGEGAGNLAITDFGVGGTIFLEGNVQVSGNLSKGGGSFKIDHPLDPSNKYLSHSFVESPDMMNVYNGNITTDRRGLAVVTLPGYFEALNRDFRYQLTVIGQFAQAIVAREISNNRFTIRTNRPGVKVSWQVTGIRHDAFADAHRIPNEEEKPQQERGHYLHPELFGAPAELAIGASLSGKTTADQHAAASLLTEKH